MGIKIKIPVLGKYGGRRGRGIQFGMGEWFNSSALDGEFINNNNNGNNNNNTNYDNKAPKS